MIVCGLPTSASASSPDRSRPVPSWNASTTSSTSLTNATDVAVAAAKTISSVPIR